MKPKNKFQKEILALSKMLPQITEVQKNWAYKHCFEFIGRRIKKGVISCTNCGDSWTDKEVTGKCNCPHCGMKLHINDTRNYAFRWNEYFGMVTSIKGFQVIRYFFIKASFRAGKQAEFTFDEVVQRWIAPNGKQATIARLRGMSQLYYDLWDLNSPLEIRPFHRAHEISPAKYYPHKRLIPELKRSGFTGKFYDLHPADLFHTLLSDSRAETLLKAGQIKMLSFMVRASHRKIDFYWPSIRICLRNNYMIDAPSMWYDYIDNLTHFGKDIRNAKYVCPENLQTEHDRYMRKRKKEYEQQQLEEKRKRMAEDEQRFKELKAKFFGLAFTDGTIEIRVLESVLEFYEEGNAMHHCVFNNSYFLKSDSLILSATIEGKRVETIEVSLLSLKVVQSRGLRNQNTQFHKQIIELVNSNVSEIQKRMSA